MPPFPAVWSYNLETGRNLELCESYKQCFFCDDYFALKQSDLATESDDEIVRVYFIKCNSVFE